MKNLLIAASVIVILFGTVTLPAYASPSFDGAIYYPMNSAIYLGPATSAPQGIPWCSGGALQCYSPSFIAKAYNFAGAYSHGLTGAGQTIVIVDAFGSPTIRSDLATFDALFGLPPPPSFTIICPDGGCPTDLSTTNPKFGAPGWGDETSLDVQWAHAVAPGANIVLAVAPIPGNGAMNAVVGEMIQMFPGAIISQSFGTPEAAMVHGNNAQVIQSHANYLKAVNNHITVLASTGDFGASNGGYPVANAGYPSSDPYVLAIGGTQGLPYNPSFSTYCTGASCLIGLVTVNNSTGQCHVGRPTLDFTCQAVGYGGEQVWNEPSFGLATGGAPSMLFGVPSFQSGLGLSSRTTPDVSYNAAISGGVLTIIGGGLYIVGGTSAGSPQWAGIFALYNQYRANLGKSNAGFITPALYSLAKSGTYTSDFHDITVGNDILAGTSIGFSATSHWDDASGWGTPNVWNLIQDLSNSLP